MNDGDVVLLKFTTSPIDLREATVVMLIPSRTDTAYFHDWIFGKASEVRFLRGRLKFTDEDGNGEDAAPFPSAVIVWRSPESTGREFATWHI